MSDPLPTRRSPNRRAHPDLADAVSVSRFWRMVDTSPDGCWPWRGDTNKGYGVFHYRGRLYGAHELALSFSTGEKRVEGLDTCHSCDNPICCNPAHLRFDTRKSNVREMHERDRDRNGARLTEEDVVLIRQRRASGARQCDLAAEFGVTDGTISMIVRGERWKRAGGPIEGKNSHYRRAA